MGAERRWRIDRTRSSRWELRVHEDGRSVSDRLYETEEEGSRHKRAGGQPISSAPTTPISSSKFLRASPCAAAPH